ncbi:MULTISPECIES: class I SAM-dependent methyltransferase [unclassified Methylophilus]|uniref:class I SAM-dependent methyltransferase n=1 Tax=unclassified Methylophilus TaxID=2630143 RepID=UPI0023B2BE0B|nr:MULTISPECIES: class I SAM-dependent methyltransferase [unclassified Methylophilus]MDT7850768.1 class I SAM-dependent methyltransferase [Methylophilus sp. VKM B-3414]BEV08148.1 class I SAM-dependent methyltransferase [Methylophilus sp. DW102]
MPSAKLSVETLLPKPWLQRLLPKRLWCQALLIQTLSILLIAGLAPGVINSVFAFELSHLGISLEHVWIWLLLHICLVSLLAKAAQMPVWWRWIHAIFPVAVLGMQHINLPATVYLAGFIITLTLYWSVHNTRVPFYPSFPATWRALHHVLEQHGDDAPLKVLDIGSGIGDLALFLASQRVHDEVSGIEIAPLPWAVSAVRALFSGTSARFTLGDYRELDFAKFDVIFAYLSPAVMPDVWQKVRAEMPAGTLFVSSEFPVPDMTAQRIIYPQKNAPALYVYSL